MFKYLNQMKDLLHFKRSSLLLTAGVFWGQSAFGSYATVENLNKLKRCDDFNHTIPVFCSDNREMLQTLNDIGDVQRTQRNLESGRSSNIEDVTLALRRSTISSQAATQEVQQMCLNAASKCRDSCNAELMEAATDPKRQEEAQRFRQIGQKCVQELQETRQKTNNALSEIAAVLASIAQMMQALGIGQNDDVKLAELEDLKSDDPCEGQFADSLIACTGQSGPDSSRANLNGGVLAGGGALNGDGLFQSANQGEPGGDRDGFNKASRGPGAGGFMGGGGMGMMGSGFGGLDGGSDGSANGGESEISSDIHKGYMGTGGGSGGGGGGGASSGAARSAAFKGFSKTDLDSDGQARAALDRKLNKLTNTKSSRAPASADGTNGPFQDNWSVITKAYKKNSSSMFHQK